MGENSSLAIHGGKGSHRPETPHNIIQIESPILTLVMPQRSNALSQTVPPFAHSPSWLSGICERMQDGLRSLDPHNLDLLYLNPAAEKLYQRSWAGWQETPQDHLHCIVVQDRDRVKQTLDSALRTQGGELEYSIILPDGETRRIRDRYWLTTDTQGNPLSIDSLLTPLQQPPTPYNATETASLAAISQNLPGIIYQYLQRVKGTADFIYISPSLKTIYELDPQQVKQKEHLMWEIIHPDDLPFFQKTIEQATQQQQQWEHEWRIIPPSGNIKWMAGFSQPNLQDNGDIIWDGLIIDITHRKQAEQEQDKLRILIENSNDFIGMANLEGQPLFINRAGRRMLGLSESESVSSFHVLDCIWPEDIPVFQNEIIPTVIEQGFWRGEVRFKNLATQTLIPVDYSGYRLTNPDTGQPYAMATITRDISERQQAEIAIREQEQLLRSIYDGIEVGFFVIDVTEDNEYIFKSWNRVNLEYYNLTFDQIAGKTLAEVFGKDREPELRSQVSHCIQCGHTVQYTNQITLKGRTNWWLTTLYPLHHDNGQVYRVIGTNNDITEQKRTEFLLQQQAEQESLLNRLVDRIRQSLDLDTVIETAVQEIYNAFTVDRAYFIWYIEDDETPYWNIVHERKQDHLPSILGKSPVSQLSAVSERIQQGTILRIDNIDQYPDPDIRNFFQQLNYTALLAYPVQTQSGRQGAWAIARVTEKRPWTEAEVELIEAVATQLILGLNQAELYEQSRNQTLELERAYRELQQAQTQLIQSEKMSSLGQLVAGVAHEINNPVNFIYGNITHATEYTNDILNLLQLYQDNFPEATPEIEEEIEAIDLEFLLEDLPKMLKSMKLGADRIKEIVKSLRTFSRFNEAEMKAVNLHDNIDSTIMILYNRIKAKSERPEIQIIKNYGDLPPVGCYAGQLNQVFMNLISNAIDALEEKSQDLTYSELENNPNQIEITTEEVDNIVKICITDNANGIPASKVEHIFDPFFTTKPVGKGTGLGLSISYQIITETHQGQLLCESELGKGTKFMIEIPQQQQT
ncbi:PAS domain-containing protein [Spirulina sp. CS-785/01]|uniref:PAS domain-containing protein n=1 Tax=Spirulina sp. CS-785/01 TaxID=3021716 RepID=UPI00232B5431|nr:PAS domain-containing protein [Spirulina sp. CS-785/01]MDB9315022.1 PAS domain-containing protein [Spirulina sp. CS-785/01]